MGQKFVSVVVLLALSIVAAANAQVPAPDPSAAHVPEGFRVEVVLKDLTYPTSVEFDKEGSMYVVEAGYSYGDPSAVTRILRVDRKGAMSTYVQEGLNGPVADLLHHDGRLYVAHRGKISVVEKGKLVKTGHPSPEITDLRCPLFSDVFVHLSRMRRCGNVGISRSERDFQVPVDRALLRSIGTSFP